MTLLETLFSERLGSGDWGPVYAPRPNTVVKITRDQQEAKTAKRLLKDPHPDFVRVFAVRKYGRPRNRYNLQRWLIVRERADGDVTPLDAHALTLRLEAAGIEAWDSKAQNQGYTGSGEQRRTVIRDLGGVRFPEGSK